MIVIIISSIIAVLLSLIAGYTSLKQCLKIAFILLTVVACIHYNYGNDYIAYYETWSVISNTSLTKCLTGNSGIFPDGVRPDIGWIVINKLFSFTGGFYCLVAFISIFENVIYFNLIKSLAPRKWWWLAVFVYLFNYRFYVLNFSMLRQGLTICLGILSLYCFEKKRYISTVLLLVIACSIHISALVLIPVFIACKIAASNVRRTVKILSIVTIVLFASTSVATRIFSILIENGVVSKYKQLYAGWTASGSYGLGFLLIVSQYVLMLCFLYFYEEADDSLFVLKKTNCIANRQRMLILIAYSAFLVKPFEVIGAALVSRLSFYFSVFDIAVLPWIYSKMNMRLIKVFLVVMLITVTLYSYYGFWVNPVYQKHFTIFHTVFEAL